ncbi:hypothetical protein [Thiolapillus sp.]
MAAKMILDVILCGIAAFAHGEGCYIETVVPVINPAIHDAILSCRVDIRRSLEGSANSLEES